MKFPERVTLCEVGLRDGLQNEPKLLSVGEKHKLLQMSIDAGFRVIEVGSFVSPRAVPQMADTDALFRAIGAVEGVELRALIANRRGLDRAIACGCRKVKLNVSASVGHNLSNLNCTPAESVARFGEIVAAAKENGVAVSGSISMAFGSPWDREIPVSEVRRIVEAYLTNGVTELSLSDASGQAFPKQVFDLCTELKGDYGGVTWWLHFHNTRGLAMANILAGMEAGVTRFDASFLGVGGCPFVPGAAGNVATEDVVHMLDGIGVKSGIDADRCIETAKYLQELIGHACDSYVLRAGKASELYRGV